VVFDIMQPAYPELSEASAFITNIIENEEIRFLETLDSGLKLLNDSLSEIKAKGETQVPGDVIFKLYDTFGFPVDIVRDVVRDENMQLDMEGFDNAMARQRERSRSVATFATISDAYKRLSAAGFKPEFRGYQMLTSESKVVLIVADGSEISEAAAGQSVELVTAETPFYAEAGGQVGDTGKITHKNFEMEVVDTIKDPTGLVIHKGNIISGTVKKGNKVTLSVDGAKREATALNHTATHILHAVLREVLGEHVKQAGSLVAPERLRFDFTHFSQIDPETLADIETRVNRRIRENVDTQTQEMEAEKAFKSGATALFEEKYGDQVRVVSLSDFSKELCGGTHTGKTGDIGLFKVVSESSIASGVRRIEALTGEGALAHVQKTTKLLEDIAHLVKEKPDALTSKVEKILGDFKALEKEVDRLKAKAASESADTGAAAVKSIHNTKVLIQKVSADNPAALRDLADRLKEKLKSGIVVLGSVKGPKAFLIVGVTKDLTKRFHAGNVIKQIKTMSDVIYLPANGLTGQPAQPKSSAF
jgi:alanyl-tRNA synthetase